MGYNENYVKYLKNEDWNYDFEKNNEMTKVHWEQSILSRHIFKELVQCWDQTYTGEILSDHRSIALNKGDVRVDFLFDVMHNPNKPHQPYFLAEKTQKQLTFSTIYHTIGNFAPVPRTIITKYYGPNLQMVHRDLNELWCWFLKYMQENWNNWPTKVHEKISFKEYIIYSCQHLYYKDIFDEIYLKYKDVSMDDIDWKKYVIDWNKKIREATFHEELLSMNDLFEEKNVEEIDKMINFLIEARGRCILDLLRHKI